MSIVAMSYTVFIRCFRRRAHRPQEATRPPHLLAVWAHILVHSMFSCLFRRVTTSQLLDTPFRSWRTCTLSSMGVWFTPWGVWSSNFTKPPEPSLVTDDADQRGVRVCTCPTHNVALLGSYVAEIVLVGCSAHGTSSTGSGVLRSSCPRSRTDSANFTYSWITTASTLSAPWSIVRRSLGCPCPARALTGARTACWSSCSSKGSTSWTPRLRRAIRTLVCRHATLSCLRSGIGDLYSD